MDIIPAKFQKNCRALAEHPLPKWKLILQVIDYISAFLF